jgi:adenosylhomocysteine nucleosidase
MKILTVVPTQEELDFFVQHCVERGLPIETSALGPILITRLPSLDLTVAPGGLGKAEFAVQTQYLIDSGEAWAVVICAGAAGALSDRLSIGDVVIGTQTIEYDIRNKFGQPLLPQFNSAERVVEDFRRLKTKDHSFRLQFGPIASGDEDIVDATRRREVRELTGAIANAWEGAGGARASYFSRLPFVEIRGISDNADETAAQDFEKNLRMTMRNVAIVITKWAGRHVDKRRIDRL